MTNHTQLDSQYTTTDKYQSRFRLYGLSDDGRDVHQEIVNHVIAQNYAAHQTILDVGCGDLQVLRHLQGKTSAALIGIDLYPRLKRKGDKFRVRQGSADKLPFEDNSFDCILALFMLYYMDDPIATLKELRRVLKPGGQLIVATSGNSNKIIHRVFEGVTAEILGCSPPPIHISAFNDVVAHDLLPKLFNIKSITGQHSKIVIDSTLKREMYLDSLRSMWQPDLGCKQSDWDNVIAAQVVIIPLPFIDIINRHWWVCEKEAVI